MSEFRIEYQPRSTTDPYEKLATAICMQAIRDYRFCGKKMILCPPEKAVVYRKELISISKFFRSNLFAALCDADGEEIIAALDEEVFGIDECP